MISGRATGRVADGAAGESFPAGAQQSRVGGFQRSGSCCQLRAELAIAFCAEVFAHSERSASWRDGPSSGGEGDLSDL